MARKKQVKVKIKHDHKESSPEDLTKSGPQVNDIRNRSSRWRSLPAKNVIKIKAGDKKKKSVAYSFYKGLFFVIVGVLGLVIVGSFLYWQFFAVRGTAAALVPVDTLVYGQVNINGILFPDEQKDKALADLAKQNDPLIRKGTNLINQRIEPLGAKFATDIKPLLGRNLYFSYFLAESGVDEEEKAIISGDWVFIADMFDVAAADDVLRKIGYRAEVTREDYQGVEIISIHDDNGALLTHCLFLDDYLVLSHSRSHLQAVVKTYQQEYTALAQSTYLTGFNPLTLRNKLLYLYLQPTQLSQYISTTDNMSTLWDIVLSDVQNAIVTMEAKEEGLLFSVTAQQATTETGKRISQELVSYLPTDTSGFIAGHNFNEDLTKFKQDLADKSPAGEFYFNNFQRNIEEKSRLNLHDDLLKYLDDDYLVAFDHNKDRTDYNFIFKLKRSEQAKTQTTAIEEAVANYLGSVHPLTQEITLSDDSKAKELLPDQESFKFTDLDFAGVTVRSVTNESLDSNPSYVILEDKLLASTSLESLKSLLVASDSQTSGKSLANKRHFNLPYSEAASWQSESVFYFDVSDLIDFLKLDVGQKQYIESFDTFLLSYSSQDKKILWQGFGYTEPSQQE